MGYSEFVMAPPEDFFSPDFAGVDGYEKAFGVAIGCVRYYNNYHPDSCSGLHAVHLTIDGVQEVAYEKHVL